jgi:hypothetical protein
MAKIPAISVAPGLNGEVLSRLYIDGVPLEDLKSLYEANTAALGGTKWDSPNRFWATPQRRATSPIREVMEVSLNTTKLVNKFQFRLSNFPCRAWLQYYNERYEEWRPVRRKRNGKPVVVTLKDSTPKVVHEGVFDNTHRHHQHRGAGHWHDVNVHSRNIKASRFRLVLTRIPTKGVPRDRRGDPVNYSLAVQDFQVGHTVADRTDLPGDLTPTQQVDLAETFSSSTDLLGSPVDFVLRQYSASDILWPTRAAIARTPKSQRVGEDDIWKCEPQPVPYAVVNLYADARDGNGGPQTVDRFEVDPTTSGVSVNLYYSAQALDLSGGFEASDSPLRFPGLQPRGAVSSKASGVLFPAEDFGYLDIDNTMIQWDPAKDWWVGLAIQPQFASTSTDPRVFIDWPGLRVEWKDSQIVATVRGATLAAPATFVVNDSLRVVVVSEGDQVQMLMPDFNAGASAAPYVPQASGIDLATGLPFADQDLAGTLRFGALRKDSNADVGRGGYILAGAILKQGAFDGEEFLSADTLGEFLARPEIGEERPDHTRNALLRQNPDTRTVGDDSINPWGFVGGPGDIYESLEWTPINRDFKLHKGLLKFDPVLARFFKFEFTNLVAQPYSSIFPMTRKVKVFTRETYENSVALRNVSGASEASPGGSGAKVNQDLGAVVRFADQQRLMNLVHSENVYPEYTPTEALYAEDPNAQDRLKALSPSFNLIPWHQGVRQAPRFTQVGRHYYETIEVRHTAKVAYFVGLNSIRMFKVDYTAADDTEEYLLHFHDMDVLETSARPWRLDSPSGLTAASLIGGYVEATSKVLSSRRNVRGIQFATSQTPPHQMLSDPDFNDPRLLRWRRYGGAQITQSSDLNTDIGTTVRVDRVAVAGDSLASNGFWNFIEQMGTWNDIEGSEPDPNLPVWDDLAADTLEGTPASTGGIESSQFLYPAVGGRIYAAARVYAPTNLGGPLHLQIVAETGEVLADEVAYAQPGRITEWYVGHTVGEGGSVPDPGRTWADVEALGTWDAIEASDPAPYAPTWDDVALVNQAEGFEGYDGRVSVRLYQEGATRDTFYVDNISLFEDPIVWEFSNDDGNTWYRVFDIRNNPHAAFLFPSVPSETQDVGDGSSLRFRVRSYRQNAHVSALLIRPWYSTMELGAMPRETIEHGGPNQTPYDQFPAVTDSPMFKTWSKPIPENWWFLYRQFLLQEPPVVETPTAFWRNLSINPGGESGNTDGWEAEGGTVVATQWIREVPRG